MPLHKGQNGHNLLDFPLEKSQVRRNHIHWQASEPSLHQTYW